MVRAQVKKSPVGGVTVDYIRQDLEKMALKYVKIDDALEGQDTIKEKQTVYLPTPDALSILGVDRYGSYLKRAVFYNIGKRTLDGMVGEIFARDPVEENIPAALDAMVLDVTGSGVSLTQLAKKASRKTLAHGRVGLLIDFPKTDGKVTKEQQATGEIRPTITVYNSVDCINWRFIKRGSKRLPSLIVLRETNIIADGAFGEAEEISFRVLRLKNDAEYVIEVWKGDNNQSYNIFETINPTGPDGKPFDEIPFMFIGAETNDDTLDTPPIYDLIMLNLAHYCNSADYEDSCFTVGQPTPAITGLTKEWVTDVMGKKIKMGSNGNIMLPVNADIKLLQAEPNTMPKEAMDAKERQMVAIGARLVEQKSVQRTATEASLETASEMATLTNIAKNVSAAFKWALEWASYLQTGKEIEITYKLNSEFDLAKPTPDMIAKAIEAWQAAALTFEEMRAVLKKAGYATIDDAEAKDIIAQEAAEKIDLMGEDTAPGNDTPPGDGEDTLAEAA